MTVSQRNRDAENRLLTFKGPLGRLKGQRPGVTGHQDEAGTKDRNLSYRDSLLGWGKDHW